MGFNEKKRQAFELINNGQKDEAAKLLFELIVDCAENNDFAKADSLRQTLIKTNPMALTEIISSGEVLEEKKYNKIDQIHKLGAGIVISKTITANPRWGNAYPRLIRGDNYLIG